MSGGRRSRVLFWIAAFPAIVLLLALGVGSTVAGRMMNRTLPLAADLPVSDEALRIQQTLDVVDLHADALVWKRNLLRRSGWGHVDLPRLIEGRVALQSFTTVTKTPRGMNIESNSGDSDNITLLAFLEAWPYRTWGSLLERALYQGEKLGRVAANSGGRFALIRTRRDLESYLALHHDEPETSAGFLGIEGAHALEGDLANVDKLFDAGFRMFGLTHFFDNEVGGSAHGVARGGLTDFGRRVVVRMESLGVLIDLAHASPALIDDVLAVATRPVVVSHTGVRGTCDNRRNLDDARLVAIGATGGVVGIGLWETALCGTTPAGWARAVRHAASVAGVEHVGLGSDWDGAVTSMIDASQTVHLTQALLDEGFGEDDIRKIMGGNAIRVLLETLPSGVTEGGEGRR
jgi:microsomal dipeptidase-like Zn-dependent dipeptidase